MARACIPAPTSLQVELCRYANFTIDIRGQFDERRLEGGSGPCLVAGGRRARLHQLQGLATSPIWRAPTPQPLLISYLCVVHSLFHAPAIFLCPAPPLLPLLCAASPHPAVVRDISAFIQQTCAARGVHCELELKNEAASVHSDKGTMEVGQSLHVEEKEPP